MKRCSYIDGVASSEALDSSGEIVNLQGLDISSLEGAALTWEHESKNPSVIVGKILEAVKIFSKEDCKNDRQTKFWLKYQIPFLYIVGRLFDDKKNPKPSAVEVASLFKDDAEHPEEKPIVGFSVEGAKLATSNGIVTHSIARKVTITNLPCNKTCVAELLPAGTKSKKDDLSNLFKGEMELFKFEPSYEEILSKKEKDLEKDVGSGGGAFIGSSLACNEKDMKKAMTAGSGMAAPAQLEGGAALSAESLGKKLHKKEKTNWSDRANKAYEGWSDREKFRGYMKKRMPHLAGGEVDAIGRILALKKDMDKESNMSKMYSSYFTKSELEKAQIDEGNSDSRKRADRRERNERSVSEFGKVSGVPARTPKNFADQKWKGVGNSPAYNKGIVVAAAATTSSGKGNMGAMSSSSSDKAAPRPKQTMPKPPTMNKTTDIMLASENKKK